MTGRTGDMITPNVLIRTILMNIMGMMNAIDIMRLSAAGRDVKFGVTDMAALIPVALTDIMATTNIAGIMENDAI